MFDVLAMMLQLVFLMLTMICNFFWYMFQVGFFSGRKRESIFKSPDDPYGKVGVTGSGKGLTEFQKREKHLHLKGATVEGDE